LKRYKYNGKERDEETGLYAYGMRYYAAWLCRFVSCDPLQFEQPDKQPFHYCSNNPINRVDKNGMLDDEPPKTAGFDKKSEDNFVIPYENEVKLRLEYLNKEIKDLDVSSDTYKSYSQQINEYNNILGEIDALRNDPDNLYIITETLSLKENVQGEVKYGGKTDDGHNIISVLIKDNKLSIPFRFNTIAHELKHAYQFYDKQLGFILNEEKTKQVSNTNSKPLEKEAFMRGDMFSGKTMTNNKDFNKNPN
jgi:RHS repeat-associated protein